MYKSVIISTISHTCCCINGEKAFGVPRNKSVGDFLIWIFIVVGCIELNNLRASWAVFQNGWIVYWLFRERYVIVFVLDLYINLRTDIMNDDIRT